MFKSVKLLFKSTTRFFIVMIVSFGLLYSLLTLVNNKVNATGKIGIGDCATGLYPGDHLYLKRGEHLFVKVISKNFNQFKVEMYDVFFDPKTFIVNELKLKQDTYYNINSINSEFFLIECPNVGEEFDLR